MSYPVVTSLSHNLIEEIDIEVSKLREFPSPNRILTPRERELRIEIVAAFWHDLEIDARARDGA